jgi:hypothetical protein
MPSAELLDRYGAHGITVRFDRVGRPMFSLPVDTGAPSSATAAWLRRQDHRRNGGVDGRLSTIDARDQRGQRGRTRGYVQPLRRPTEMQLLGHRDEVAQVAQLHRYVRRKPEGTRNVGIWRRAQCVSGHSRASNLSRRRRDGRRSARAGEIDSLLIDSMLTIC